MGQKVIKFGGPLQAYGFLSNFYSSVFTYKELFWTTTEHAFQADKTLIQSQIREIQEAKTPGKAKRLGQKVTLREDWEQIKDNVMLDVCMAKFLQNSDLEEQLLATGNAILVEHTPWKDYYWGDGGDGTGQNRLGQILMSVRSFCLTMPRESRF